jgi:O-antigen/teichoic acid export membrane protein
MKKNIIFYALSTAISKGSILLFFPFLTLFLSLEDFGIWSLVIIVSNLLIPILSLNGSASILREGSENISKGFYLLKYYLLFSILLNSFIISFIYVSSFGKWLLYSVVIGFLEGILLLLITYFRALEKAEIYFIINFIKMLLLFGLVFFAYKNNFVLYKLLNYHLLILSVFVLVVLIYTFISNYIEDEKIFLKNSLIFSLTLIPHGMSQWIMSSSDRVILGYILGSKDVGIYSLAYNISMVLMLINSAIALALPNYVIKNYKYWKKGNYDNRIIKIYTFISLGLFFTLLSVYNIDKLYFGILGYYGKEIIPLIFIIYFGIYLLGLYYFYANYLFYHKKAYIISRTTFYAASINIILTILLVYIYGVLGAALATLLAYTCYLYIIRKESLKIEKDLDIKLSENISLFTLISIILGVGFFYV